MPRRPRATSRHRQAVDLRRFGASLPQEHENARPGEPIRDHKITTGADLLGLEHVGLAVADPDAMCAFLCGHVGMRELSRTQDGVVVGAGDGAASLALVAAGGPRDAGALGRIILRTPDVDGAVAALPAGVAVDGDGFERADFEGPEGLALGFTLVAGGGIDHDIDHVVLNVTDPEQTRVGLAELGCVPRGQSLHLADKHITLHESPAPTPRPLLHHLAVRVDRVKDVEALALERGLQIDGHAGEGRFAITLPGPEQVRLRFVQAAQL